MEESGVVFYCDLHAHSRKFNVFMYGCENRRHSEKYLREQIYPLMLHKNTSEKFSFEDCKYIILVRYWISNVSSFVEFYCYEKSKIFGQNQHIVASGIDIGQGINVGPGKFGKKNKRRALNNVLEGD